MDELFDPKDVLCHYLQEARDALLWKLEGLSEHEVRLPRTPTGTTARRPSRSACTPCPATTTYTRTQSADASALVVGACVTASGEADDKGAVVADLAA